MTTEAGIPANEGCAAPGLKRVFLVEDDRATLDALSRMLRHLGYAVDAFRNIDSFLAHPRDAAPAVLVTDMRLGAESGLDLQRRIADAATAMPVIFISGHGDIPMAVEAIQHGAFDFLPKPFSDQDLLDRVQRALALDAENRRLLAQRELLRARHESLTPREREVLTLVTQGKPNKVMAGDLGVSQRTVEIHRARVMEKMGANSLAQLVRMMLELDTSSSRS